MQIETPQSEERIQPWRLKWQAKHVNRFWDWMAAGRSGREEVYFSESVGDAVINTAKRHIALNGTVLDLGAARGFLTKKLLARGVRVIAVDSSPGSIASIEAMCAGDPSFLGARLGGVESIPADDDSVDVVFILEVVEHLDDEALGRLFPELRRVLRSGGYVIITTPNDENLSDLETICPNCGCQFHMMQHVRSWNASLLGQVMSAEGFREILAKPTLFSRYGRSVKRWLQEANRRARGRKHPHLIYIGQKI